MWPPTPPCASTTPAATPASTPSPRQCSATCCPRYCPPQTARSKPPTCTCRASGGGGWFDTIRLVRRPHRSGRGRGRRPRHRRRDHHGPTAHRHPFSGRTRPGARRTPRPPQRHRGLPGSGARGAARPATRCTAQPLSANCVYAVYDPVTAHAPSHGPGTPHAVVVRPDSSIEVPDCPPGPLLGSAEGPPFATTTSVSPTAASSPCTPPRSCPQPPTDSASPPRGCATSSAQPGRPLSELCDDILYTLRGTDRPDDVVLLLARTRPFPPDSVATWLLDHDTTAAATARGHTPPDTRRVERERRHRLRRRTDRQRTRHQRHPLRHPTPAATPHQGPHPHLRGPRRQATSPRLRHARTVDEGGRGLFIVAQLAQSWGTRYTTEGKTVWSEQTLPTPASPHSEPTPSPSNRR